MALAVDRLGNVLLAVELDGDDGDDAGRSSGNSPAVPLTGALVIASGPPGLLLVHDVWRDQWELPGGGIEDGESPVQAAAREVAEESGQVVTGLRHVGAAVCRLGPDDRLERADLYTGRIERVRAFTANRETDAIRWWDGSSPLPGLSPIDAALVAQVVRWSPPGRQVEW